MNRISINKSGLPITLFEALATNDKGEKLFVVPKILVFVQKENIGIGNIGSRQSKTVDVESQVSGYIPLVGDQAYELYRCVQKLHKEINIVGNLKNKSRGNLTGVLIDSSRILNDENGRPHTGWIKIIAKSYKVDLVKDKTK